MDWLTLVKCPLEGVLISTNLRDKAVKWDCVMETREGGGVGWGQDLLLYPIQPSCAMLLLLLRSAYQCAVVQA